jgi:hypothetical protein
MPSKPLQVFLLSLILSAVSCPCFASEFMKVGMAEYAAGNYGDAAGHFGGALSTDFNNATLHYYLGSCYAHMKQKEAAVREFRIAYALEPDKEVGHYARQALELYGFDTVGATDKKNPNEAPANGSGVHVPTGASGLLPGAMGSSSELSSPSGHSNQSTEMPRQKTILEKQAEELANMRAEQGRISSDAAGKQGEELIKQRTRELLDANSYTTRRGRYIPATQLYGDDKKNIDSLRSWYESQKSSYAESAQQSREIQRTADSLRELMNEEQHAGKMHLSPSGTNLYVRSYEMSPSATSKTPITPEKTLATPEKSTTATPENKSPGDTPKNGTLK